MIKKNIHGILSLLIGVVCFIGTIVMYNTLTIDDVFIVILMTFSLMILTYGLFQVIRDAYFK